MHVKVTQEEQLGKQSSITSAQKGIEGGVRWGRKNIDFKMEADLIEV